MAQRKQNPEAWERKRPHLVVTVAPEVLAEAKRRAAGGAPATRVRHLSRVVEDALREAFGLAPAEAP